MKRWGMVIDLTRCTGCYACVIACKVENGTPKDVFWSKVLEYETGVYPNARRTFLPILCFHCENPPCVEVCPSGATFKRPDGIVDMNYDKCIGCRYCIMACPYDARYFMDRVDGYFPEKGLTPYEEAKYKQWQVGTVAKCTGCPHRVAEGQDPACVTVCPTNCRIFGDLGDPESEACRLVSEKRGEQLLPEFGAKPSVFYIR